MKYECACFFFFFFLANVFVCRSKRQFKGTHRRFFAGERSVGRQTKPKTIIHCGVIQAPFHGGRQSKGIVLLNITRC